MNSQVTELSTTLGIAATAILGWAYLLTTVAHSLLMPTLV